MRALSLLPLLLFLSSCEIINPDEQEPAFLHISEFDLVTDDTIERSDSENITELWVFAEGDMVGAYDLPADIPILAEGPTTIRVAAGIRNNGISSTRIVYPYYTVYEEVVDLEVLQTDTITPVFNYRENLAFWHEDFEDPGLKFSDVSNSDTILYRITEEDEVFEGIASGAVYIDNDNRYFLGLTEENFQLPVGSQIYLEMDYKCENTFAVGVEADVADNEQRAFALIVNPTVDEGGTAQWNKIYIELSFAVGGFVNASSFELYIESTLDDGNSSAELYFDNIKLIYFN